MFKLRQEQKKNNNKMFTLKNTILLATPLATILYTKFVMPGAWTVLAATLVTEYLAIYGVWASIQNKTETNHHKQSAMQNIAYPIFALSSLFVFADIAKRLIEARYSFFLVLGVILALMYVGAAKQISKTANPKKENRDTTAARILAQHRSALVARLNARLNARDEFYYPDLQPEITEPKLYVMLDPQPKPKPVRDSAVATEQKQQQPIDPNETKEEKIKRIRAKLLEQQNARKG
jgi:hypothetical protein